MTCLSNVALQHLDLFKAVVFATHSIQQTVHQVVLSNQTSLVNCALLRSQLSAMQILSCLQTCLFHQHDQLLILANQNCTEQIKQTPKTIGLFNALFGDIRDTQTSTP